MMKWKFLLPILFLAAVLPCTGSGPEGLLEAEALFIREARFTLRDDIHTSGGQYIGRISGPAALADAATLIAGDFPADGRTYDLWICLRALEVALRSPSLTREATAANPTAEWRWLHLGRFAAAELGSTFSIQALPDKNNQFPPLAGIDALLLSDDPDFVPAGVYRGHSQAAGETGKAVAGQELPQIQVDIATDRQLGKISPYIAAANAHGPAGHLVDSDGWDEGMKTLFHGSILGILLAAEPNGDSNELDWDYAAIDAFIQQARQQWQVGDLMLFPQWWVDFAGRETPPEAQLAAGGELLMKLVRRYGDPAGENYIRNWVVCDEWPCGGYWREQPAEFARYYARLIREMKQFNPELVIGGPVDCYPNETIIAALLEEAPELDFIAWNMFITGRADTPLEELFSRTAAVRTQLKASRELGRAIQKRDIPVWLTSLGPNFHAWDPLDLRLAEPVIGAWHALALNYAVEGGAEVCMFYNVRARDCGFLGPDDASAVQAGMRPAKDSAKFVNIRPAGRMIAFYQQHFAGKTRVEANYPANARFNAMAATDDDGKLAISLVNYAATPQSVKLSVQPFAMPPYGNFELPVEYLYCDQHTVCSGNGLLVDADGNAELLMPPYSSWCFVLTNEAGRAR
ncbi:hypothetical protein [Victivallis sp. Marseille-Q1083]|uniref:hypothetical protein n=1 Tax=Victivallis sp. Marseille-Q1083 TaxID=2717288 RepID=UPI00158BE753|nr:hypothetical protein [Victivallis sp. Marseille-Q1083]